MLHIINNLQDNHRVLVRCLTIISQDDAIILIGDAVFAVLYSYCSPEIDECLKQNIAVHALEPDLSARGIITTKRKQCIKYINYEGFIDLVVAQPNSQSW